MLEHFDPRDRDDNPRDLEMRWVERGRDRADGYAHVRDRDDDSRERDVRDWHVDPCDVFPESLGLQRRLGRGILLVSSLACHP